MSDERPQPARECAVGAGEPCALPGLAAWRSEMREALTVAREQRDRLLDVIAAVGRPPWSPTQAQRVFDEANEIAKETGHAA